MLLIYTEGYFREREQAARKAAAAATCAEVRDIHLELAERYALLCSAAKARMGRNVDPWHDLRSHLHGDDRSPGGDGKAGAEPPQPRD